MTTKSYQATITFLALFYSGLSTVVICADGWTSEGKCETMTASMCKDMPYNKTIMPNSLNHTNEHEAKLAIQKFSGLVQSRCSPHLKNFLCALHMPVCTLLDIVIPPCKGLCKTVRAGCESVLSAGRLRWPQSFSCEHFPVSGLCVGESGTLGGTGRKTSPPASKQTTTAGTGHAGLTTKESGPVNRGDNISASSFTYFCFSLLQLVLYVPLCHRMR